MAASPSTSQFVIIGHRGNSALRPENTIQAFDSALESVPAFELDVQLTSDGVCIVLHDEKMGRTIPGTGPVAECAWEDLKDLDAGSWHAASDPAHASECRVPMLSEVLERYRGRAHIHLELKSKQAGLEDAVCSDLTKAGWLSDLHQPPPQDPAQAARWALLREPTGLTITSFHLESLERSMRVLPGIPHGWLVQELSEDILERASAAGVAQLCPRVDACTKEAVDRALQRGFTSVRGWGVKTHALLRHAVACGMHGATVNWPHEAAEALRGSSPSS